MSTIFSFYLLLTFLFSFLFYQRGGEVSRIVFFSFTFRFFILLEGEGDRLADFFPNSFTFLFSFLFSEAE